MLLDKSRNVENTLYVILPLLASSTTICSYWNVTKPNNLLYLNIKTLSECVRRLKFLSVIPLWALHVNYLIRDLGNTIYAYIVRMCY